MPISCEWQVISLTQQSDLELLIALATRKVRTTEGARQYGLPIGSVITDSVDESEPDRPMTIERIKSLQRQFEIAASSGNTALMKRIQAEFSVAVREFKLTRQNPKLLRELIGSSGRNEKSVKRGK